MGHNNEGVASSTTSPFPAKPQASLFLSQERLSLKRLAASLTLLCTFPSSSPWPSFHREKYTELGEI